MTEIKILDKSVFNRIAAGEVVERPASIVKELVENAIDAGATSISISIKSGGIEMVKVSDNGSGISKDDLKTAFLPHATSKIKSVKDLDGISTLGFRGEALPSIASVSKITMLTRTSGSEMGARIIIDNGTEVDFGEMGAPFGTTVTVENLFSRIPARRKFLSKESVEENAVTNLVSRFILANDRISFKYSANGKTIYSSSGQGLEDAIVTVYGKEYLSKMIKISSTLSEIVLCGYINKPSFSKHSRSFQTIIVNGRYVENDEISYAIFGCYQKYLMKRQYPTFVLNLNIPYDLVDVNVHPNKMEVKFAIPQMVKKIVVDAIREQVLDAVSEPKSVEGIVFSPSDTAKSIDFEVQTDLPFTTTPLDSATRIEDDSSTTAPLSVSPVEQTSFFDDAKPVRKMDSSYLDIPPTRPFKSRISEDRESRVSSSSAYAFSIKSFPDASVDKNFTEQISFDIAKKSKVVGKLFNTYIVVELDDEVYLIDQHAAHEKILYDKYSAEYECSSVSIQPMLIPYEFSLSPNESSIVDENIELLANAGFNIEKNNGVYSLKTIPLCCVGLNCKTFVADFLSENDGKLLPQAFKEKLMQCACKAAVKGEDDLSQMEIDKLLDEMRAQTKELFCPHGRPIVVKLSRRDIEKWFKRIV